MNALSISNLTKTYANGFVALKNIDLDVKQGDFFALLGPNGAGKTTLIGIISSLVNKTSGKVTVMGYDLDTELKQAKSQIGLVPQEINLHIFEKVGQIVVQQAGYYGVEKESAKKRTETLLKQLGLWDKCDVQARTLSGGMKRRLMIARALVHNPNVLILDEPTAGVDIEIRRDTWEYLRKLNQSGTTIILTTHYIEEAEMLCNSVAIINHGDIIEHTSTDKLLAKLSAETFILYLTAPINVAPQLKNYPTRLIDEHTLEVDVHEQYTMNELFDILAEKKIKVFRLKNKSSRLEELFVKLVFENNAH